ncbi:Fe2OG dioxygenase domain-containing protein [Frankia sp. AiPs1]|uniref:HalD/BesD family halogenase n=1 Tax=Frankia sp. AiPa1 TaxID=573492 RepID=UPI00202B7116|nr:arpA protein [Frankia sp. AiPa1]MCL9762239.1 arpA protein [Frankia sp. AiPa1]
MGAVDARPISDLVDTTCYPVTDPTSPLWWNVVSRARHDLHTDGCCVLPGFIQPSAFRALAAECASVAGHAYDRVENVNAYNIPVDAALPADHPARITMRRGNAFVARDQIPAAFDIHRLYRSEDFRHFVAACFGLPRVHELADPLAGLCLNVISPGLEHPWHFDTNEFAVSLLTQEPQIGGTFEYCPNIRTAQAENFADVRAVLTGTDNRLVHRLTVHPGDLQLFLGRYSMHRVSPVQGSTARHSAIFAYTERAGVIGNRERTRQLFGRFLPEHESADAGAVRVDALLD